MNPSGDDTSPEVNSRRRAAIFTAGDGSSVEQSAKRSRGRPIGSKNKPKPPVIITCESEPGSSLCTHVLQIPSGGDVSECLSAFAAARRLCLCVISASGPISAATIRQNSLSPAAGALTFRGRFEIISLSATIIVGGGGEARNMSVSLAGPQGQVVGGVLVGPLVAAGEVMIVAAVFSEPVFQRLPEEEGEASGSASGEEESGKKEGKGFDLRGIQRPSVDDGGAARFAGVWTLAARPPDY